MVERAGPNVYDPGMEDDFDDLDYTGFEPPALSIEKMQAELEESEAQARAGLIVPFEQVMAMFDDSIERMRLKDEQGKAVPANG